MSLDSDENILTGDNEIKYIKLISSDEVSFTVSKINASISDLITMAIDGDKDAIEIPLPSVKSTELKNIVEYLSKKKGDTTVVVSKPLKQTMIASCTKKGKWEAEFVDKIYTNKKDLHNLILAANYMAITPLLELCCARIGLALKGKNKIQMMSELMIK